MGLFGFGKKDKAVQEQAADAVEYSRLTEKVNIKEQSYANDENRRFVMMIEEAFPAQDKEGIVTVGMMRGVIKNGDAAYLLEPGDQICMVNVIGLAVQDGGERKSVEEAANQVTGVKIYDITGREKVAKYAVLTSVKPQMNRKDPSSIENPYVWGLSYGCRKWAKEPDFFNVLISELLKANVLVAMHGEKDGYAVLTRPRQAGGADLLVFTDKYQLTPEKMEDAQNDLRVAVMKFTDCIDMVCSQNENTSGIAFNAYGAYAVALPHEMLDTIYRSEQFQKIMKENE